jgi:hypothetical protein
VANLNTVDNTNHEQIKKLLEDIETISHKIVEDRKLLNKDIETGIELLIDYILQDLNQDGLIEAKRFRDLPTSTQGRIRKSIRDVFGIDCFVEADSLELYNFKRSKT